MPDLLVIVPSRGRPQNIARLLDAVHQTARLDTIVHVGVDDDDPELPAYKEIFAEHGHEDVLETGPRTGLAGWTNRIAAAQAGGYPFLASLGDDMVPRSAGWDRALVRAILDMGGTGFSYPWDGIREDIPEAVVMSSDIVTALGWMAMPELRHFWIDDVWGELGRAAGCLRHLRAVVVDHLHPAKDPSVPGDATYRDARGTLAADQDAFHEWRRTRMPTDAEVIVKLRESRLKK